jgi:hypothetical protein
MITVSLLGGMGNQLFQYAAGFALAARHGAELRLDCTWFRGRPERWYSLDAFSISGRVATDEELRRAGLRYPGALSRGLARVGFKRLGQTRGQVCEPGFPYWPGFRELPDGTCLAGYWQSERYFEDVAEAIRRECAVRAQPDADNQRALEQIGDCEAVALHVRRGDYATDPRVQAFHGMTPLEYYQTAVERMLAHLKDPVFFLFSDDPDWVRQNLVIGARTVHLSHNGTKRDFEDLRLMSACRHHVIANSSFSWWGAWLGQRPGQRVIAPARWFRNGPDTRDLIPARWERI